MSPSSSAALTTEPTQSPIVLQTRFGEMTVDPETVLRLPRGLMGFGTLHDYALATLPEERYGRFRVLQSIEAPEVSFVVLPYEPTDALIADADLAAAFEALGVGPNEGATLLIVSIRKAGDKAIVSVNLRAPVIVDLKRRTAWQYVLTNPEYSVRHAL
jgi:flagellar assembly factor FliW